MNAQETANETWKQIWVRKGKAEGNDLLAFDGYEATQVDMEEVARQITKRLDIQKNDKVFRSWLRGRCPCPIPGLRLHRNGLFPYTG